jgi:hypothetical protein
MIHHSILYFGLGSLGGLLNSLVVWLFGAVGVNSLLGVSIQPTLSAQWLYPRIVWGGIWGLMYLIPKLDKTKYTSALLYSLAPTAVMLFVVFPFKAHKGMAGIELGMLTPLLVIFFNFVWAATITFSLKQSLVNTETTSKS